MSLEKKLSPDSESTELAVTPQNPYLDIHETPQHPIEEFMGWYGEEINGLMTGLCSMVGAPGLLLGTLHGGHPDDYIEFTEDEAKGPMRQQRRHAIGTVGGAAMLLSLGYFNPLFLLGVNVLGYAAARAIATYNRESIQNTQTEPQPQLEEQ